MGREGTPRSTPRGAGGAEGARKGRNTEQAGRRGILCRLCTAERRILTLQSCCGHLPSARPVPGDEAATKRGFPLTLCWSRARSFKSPSRQQRLRLRRHFQRVDSAASGRFSDLCQEPARNRSTRIIHSRPLSPAGGETRSTSGCMGRRSAATCRCPLGKARVTVGG